MDLLLGEHLGGMAKEELEELVLAASGRHEVARDHHLASRAVHAQVPGLEHPDERDLAAATQRPDPGQHLLEVEGLGKVVVSPGVEAGEAIPDVIEGGEHEHRGRRGLEAEVAADVHPVEIAAEHHVEHGDVVGETASDRLQRLVAGQGDVDRHAGFGQPSREAPGNLGFVLDDEHTHARIVFAVARRIFAASDSILALVNDVIARDGDLALRRMRDEVADHERIVDWRNRPHVREWWDPDDPPLTLEAAIEEFREASDPSRPTEVAIIEVDEVAAGYLQFYPWDGEQPYLEEVGIMLPVGAWGLDILIGEPSLLGRGIGSRAVRLISDHLFATAGATAVALATEAGNARAQAAYTRAGMHTVQRFLDTDVRDGQRVESILMIRDRPGGTAGGR
jgi:RimJ/RimL family protein N-acetyltransferase